MNEDEFSPIISRLDQFIGSLGLTSSQFADRIGLSRSSLSQILSGRNKSISDTLLRKIHAAYPEFNVAWLLFGSGDREETPKVETSEPQTEPESQESDPQATEESTFNECEPPVYGSPKNYANCASRAKNVVSVIIVYSDGTTDTFRPY